jgi:hypothetical protein
MPTHTIPASYHDRILEVARHLSGDIDTYNETIRAIPAAEPTRLRAILSTVLPTQVVVTGTLERRLLLAQHVKDDQWTVADLAGQVHRTRAWPLWARTAIEFDDESTWISMARISPAGVHRLTRPNVLLAALYHPEHFPLPGFPLAIGDLARAVRSTLTGQVQLMDMQLGITLDAITATVRVQRPDILGVSAIDQVVQPEVDRVWHLDRARMWRQLCARGLRRCLFGAESGVNSILTRFNKETTSSQNALAIRTLSALGVPTRFTYITFDHLMPHDPGGTARHLRLPGPAGPAAAPAAAPQRRRDRRRCPR